jgi:hypothetical protein
MRADRHRMGIVAALMCLAMTGCATSHGQDARAAARQQPAAHSPVVFLVFDEFSTTSLVDGQGRIDPIRYPNFAALARDGNWFPYATASSDETGRAMEGLLTGSLPKRHRPPVYRANRRNLFTLLGSRYRIRAGEEVTSLCPRRLCPGVKRQTKHSVLHELATGRPERFRTWLRSVRSGGRPALFFKHVLLPHGPWRYLPDGRQYTRRDPIPNWGHAFSSRWVATQKYQRHLLQVGFSDHLLGELIAKLKREGLYEKALIVVTADNGESFGRLGNGHEVTGRNAGDIALTPLIVKRPFQHDGSRPGRHVRTVDVLPTVARITHTRPRWRTQGHSVYGPAARHIPTTTTIFQRAGRSFRYSLPALKRWARSAQRLKGRLFAASLFGVGPDRALVGSPPAHARVRRASARLYDGGAFLRVRSDSSFVPLWVTGRLGFAGPKAPRSVAVAVNGRIAETSPAYRLHRGGPLYFSVLLPDSSLRDGRNSVRVYGVSGRR